MFSLSKDWFTEQKCSLRFLFMQIANALGTLCTCQNLSFNALHVAVLSAEAEIGANRHRVTLNSLFERC